MKILNNIDELLIFEISNHDENYNTILKLAMQSEEFTISRAETTRVELIIVSKEIKNLIFQRGLLASVLKQTLRDHDKTAGKFAFYIKYAEELREWVKQVGRGVVVACLGFNQTETTELGKILNATSILSEL